MEYKEALSIVEELPFDEKRVFYQDSMHVIYLYRPSVVSARYQNYDINKNFQVWLIDKNKDEFKPLHLRVLLDFKLRVMEYPELKEKLLLLGDLIFYGCDPIEAIQKSGLDHIEFHNCISDLPVIATLLQLFILEQDYGYGRKSNYQPRSLYLQGWLREFVASHKQIDELTTRICRGNPPQAKYTREDDENHRLYNPHSQPLWYLK